jgi:hypothetical protein
VNTSELKIELSELNVNPNEYSLDGSLVPDSIILFHSYNEWQVFYLDERGDRNDQRVFSSEDEACQYILKLFIDSKEIQRRFL